MSAIVQFPMHRVTAASSRRAGTTAEVVIFPGVRIERQDAALPLMPPARGSRGSAAIQEAEIS